MKGPHHCREEIYHDLYVYFYAAQLLEVGSGIWISRLLELWFPPRKRYCECLYDCCL